MQAPSPPHRQPRNPLHGLTLENIVTALVAQYGWAGLGERVPVRCFISEPSIASSLKFLRKTPWAREKVESLYLYMLRDQRREAAFRPTMSTVTPAEAPPGTST
jgi:uncharacterized protein (DUF2132 family)